MLHLRRQAGSSLRNRGPIPWTTWTITTCQSPSRPLPTSTPTSRRNPFIIAATHRLRRPHPWSMPPPRRRPRWIMLQQLLQRLRRALVPTRRRLGQGGHLGERDVYIGRGVPAWGLEPSEWGSPYKVGVHGIGGAIQKKGVENT